MAFDRQQLYITGSGQIGTGGGAGEDVFSFGMRFTGLTTFDATAALAAIDETAIGALYDAWWTAANTQISDRGHLFAIKVSALGTNGQLISGVDPRVFEPVAGGSNGFASSPDLPNQIAMVVTLRTNTNVGLAVRGRFYVPVPAMTIQTNGQMPSGAAALVAGTTKTLIDGLNAELNVGAANEQSRLAIMSSVGTGTTRGVTVISVGSVLDTVRSRRNALTETYSDETLA